jgi:hypothetical protein
MYTTVDGKKLMRDNRANLVEGSPKSWNVDKYKYDPNSQVSGSETIGWDITAVPPDVSLTLIDYGTDASRTSAVSTVDMRSQSDYMMSGITGGTGIYRYLTFSVQSGMPVSGTIAGLVTLQSVASGNMSEQTTFEIRTPGTTTIAANGSNDEDAVTPGTQVTTSATGAYTLNDIPPGTYDVTAKGKKWLRMKVVSVNVTAGNTTTVDFPNLKGGDANNTNSVNIQDLNILKSSYGKSQGNPGYDERADFNKTNSVNIQDLNILKSNYGQSGAQ